MGPWSEDEVRNAFANAITLEIAAENRPPSALFSLNGPPSPFQGPSFENFLPDKEFLTLKVAKIGALNRKDDTVDGGKKASNRKWKSWSVILTGSQLLFFRDPSWANIIEARSNGVVPPHATIFRPDELFPLKGAIALHDSSYTKVPCHSSGCTGEY